MIKFMLVVLMIAQANLACAKRNYTNEISNTLLTSSDDLIQCQYFFAKEELCLNVEWETSPSSNNYSSLIMSFSKKDTQDLIDPQKTPFVFLWMSSMGHGSTPVTMEKIAVGQYRASNIYFVMPGTWDVRFQLKSGNAIVEQHVQTLRI
jgi:hypothetical protein